MLDGRFRIDRRAGRGGMGTVFQGIDQAEGRAVAVKILHDHVGTAPDRFSRESRVLSDLRHPSIVTYIAHGETPEREPFLVMEWLEGESLGARLSKGSLDPNDALVLAHRLAEGLAHAHARGVIHRDVKPSNVLLVDRDPRRAVLLDFGIAHVPETPTWTRTGAVIGTVGYMAPEQALGEVRADARADIFSLGCLLFECLTGSPAFAGPHQLAVLAKLLRGDVPSLSAMRPSLGRELDALVTRMLARDPAERPATAVAVCEALKAVELSSAFAPLPGTETAPRPAADGTGADSSGLTGKECCVRSVLLVEPWPDDEEGKQPSSAAQPQQDASLGSIARKLGAELTALPGGKWLFAFGGAHSATDLASLAARCALEIRARAPSATVAVAMGTAETGSDVPIGPVIDRVAVRFAGTSRGRITLDETTAALLPVHFEVSDRDGVHTLDRVVAFDDEPRPLLGMKTPCVGRERELATLDMLLDTSIAERAPCAVFVEGEAGAGKTRLRQEFVARAKKRHVGLTVLVGRGELIAGSSPLVVARQLARSGFGVAEATPEAEASPRIRGQLNRLLAATAEEERLRVGDFLGELLGVKHPEPPSFELQASRDDGRLMTEWLRRSFIDWLGALAAKGPVLVVVDDLQWADATSTTWLGELLRDHTEVPVLLLGLGRPELREQVKPFRGRHEIELLGLKRRAAEELVRAVVPGVNDADVARVVELAGGNAFYLEELTRHLASGGTDLPPTVLAMAQARLEKLDPPARAALRAASVLGERFWLAGAESVLGDRATDAARWFELLAADELVAATPTSRFPGTPEFVFRHALLREAAYASLPENDRQPAHRGAATWLEGAGESNPFVMIDHYEKAGRARLAVRWYSAAAHGAILSADVLGCETLARRGLATYGVGEPRDGSLLIALAGTLWLQFKVLEAREIVLEALDRVPEGSAEWLIGVGLLVAICVAGGDTLTPIPSLMRLASLDENLVPSTDLGTSLVAAYSAFTYAGQLALAEAAGKQFDRARRNAPASPGFEGWRRMQRAWRADLDPGRVAEGYGEARESLRILESLQQSSDSDGGYAVGASAGLALAWLFVSRHASLLGELEVARDQVASTATTPFLTEMLAEPAVRAAVAAGDLAAAEALAAPALGSSQAYTQIFVRSLLAVAYADAGRHAEAATTIAEVPPPAIDALLGLRADVHMARSRVALARGDAESALVECDLGDAAVVEWGGLVHSRQLLVLTRAEALMLLGRANDAKRTLAVVRAQVEDIASKLDEPARKTYLARGFPAARIVRVAAEWHSEP